MNYISKIHQRFSERLNDPRVLTNPEDFLGENFEAVLNFWMILDEFDNCYSYNNYDKMYALIVYFRKLTNYEFLREELFNSSTLSSRIKVILLNMDYGNFSFFKQVNNYISLATLELTIDHSKPSIIQHFINELKHS